MPIKYTVEFEVEIGHIAVNRNERSKQGAIVSAREDHILINLKDGFFWEGTPKEFYDNWTTTNTPF